MQAESPTATAAATAEAATADDRMTTPRPTRKGKIDRRRALEVLAGTAEGCTEAIMLAYGFKLKVVADLVRDGLATAQGEHMRPSGRTMEVVRFQITAAGRRALA